MKDNVKFSFLLPLFDNAAQPIPASDWDWMCNELVIRFGGWSLDGKVEGSWLDRKSGRVYHDESVRYVVVVEESAVASFLAFLGEVKARFQQEALFVERHSTEVIFI